MLDYVHPDYAPEDLLATDFANESPEGQALIR